MDLFGAHEAGLVRRQDLLVAGIGKLEPELAFEHADHAPDTGLGVVLGAQGGRQRGFVEDRRGVAPSRRPRQFGGMFG